MLRVMYAKSDILSRELQEINEKIEIGEAASVQLLKLNEKEEEKEEEENNETKTLNGAWETLLGVYLKLSQKSSCYILLFISYLLLLFFIIFPSFLI